MQSIIFKAGQKVRLTRRVDDQRTGSTFPAGAVGEFEYYLGEVYGSVAFDKSFADPQGQGRTSVVVPLDALASAQEAPGNSGGE